jgi:hypothetical protein
MEAAQTPRRSLGELLVARGVLSKDDLDRAQAEQHATNRRLADILVRRGLVTAHDITGALMEQMKERRDPGAAAPDPVDRHPEPEPEPVAVIDFPVHPDAVVRTTEARRQTAQKRLEALGVIGQGLTRMKDALEAQELTTPSLVRELDATQERVRARERSLADEIAHLERIGEELERCTTELGRLRTELAGKLEDLSQVQTTAAEWNGRAADLEAEVASLTSRIDAANGALAALVGAVDAPAGATS